MLLFLLVRLRPFFLSEINTIRGPDSSGHLLVFSDESEVNWPFGFDTSEGYLGFEDTFFFSCFFSCFLVFEKGHSSLSVSPLPS